SLSQYEFSCDHIGENMVLLTVMDSGGNASTCQSVVTVVDSIAPTVICKDADLFLDESGTAAIQFMDVDGGSSDACGIQSLTVDFDSFTCENVGENLVELTAVDNNGNSSSCQAVVTVRDTMAPEVVCRDIEIYLDNNGGAIIKAADVNNGS